MIKTVAFPRVLRLGFFPCAIREGVVSFKLSENHDNRGSRTVILMVFLGGKDKLAHPFRQQCETGNFQPGERLPRASGRFKEPLPSRISYLCRRPQRLVVKIDRMQGMYSALLEFDRTPSSERPPFLGFLVVALRSTLPSQAAQDKLARQSQRQQNAAQQPHAVRTCEFDDVPACASSSQSVQWPADGHCRPL
jgi:hypothetical protein